MHIAVVGTGFVGLVMAACFAENGNTVVCVDDDASAIRTLQKGRIPIYEPGLEEIVRRNGSEGRLTFTTSLPRAVRTAQVVFLTVGAPVAGDGAPDGHHVLAIAREVARAMNGYKVVVSNCAAPVGTAERVRETIRRETTHPFSVVSNPEFLEQGAAVEAFLHPDHIVIGADDPRGAEVVKELYAPFARAGAPMMVMDCASAELSRYVANAMLATRISFMNEVAHVCELTSANVDEVRRVMASDGRIGAACLFPGVGYGGSSLPRDSKALLTLAKGKGYTFRTLEAVESVNAAQKTVLVAKMQRHFGSLKGRAVAVWGLAFQPRTDDMCEAPSMVIIETLLQQGAMIQAYDPEAMDAARERFGSRVTFARKSYEALGGADALAVVTDWHEFREPDFPRMRKLMKTPVVFDGRNLYRPAQMKAHGFTYFSIGR
jgi:UDPglucose 6-dehydrogenase